MHVSSRIRSENRSPELSIFHEQKRGLSELTKVEQAIHAACYSSNPIETVINSIVILILAPILIPIYLVVAAVTMTASIIVMTIVAQVIVLIAVSLFIVFSV